jgi:TPR repeat protein
LRNPLRQFRTVGSVRGTGGNLRSYSEASGNGVPRDFAQAVLWFTRAAERGHAMAQANLGIMYEFGNGIPKDLVRA